MGAWAVVLASGLAASTAAAEPKTTQKGKVSFSETWARSPDPHRVICGIEVSWAHWTLLGEPVEDYLFKLVPCPSSTWRVNASLEAFSTTVERENPELAKKVKAAAPLEVVVHAKVEFWTAGANGPFARGELDISPDLVEAPGTAQSLSVPGSPTWEDWFTDIEAGGGFQKAPWGGFDDAKGTKLKKAWAHADSVKIVSIYPTLIEWPDEPFRELGTFLTSKVEDVKAKDFWSAPSQSGSKQLKVDGTLKASTSAGSRHTSAKKKERSERFASRNQPALADATNGSTFGLRLPADRALTVLYKGAKLVPKDGVIPLTKGTHSLRMAVEGGHYTVAAECSEKEERKKKKCREETSPGLQLLPLCSDLDNPYHTWIVRRCDLSGWKFERAR